MPDSPTQQLLDIKLDGNLANLVRSRRSERVSWRLIAREIWEVTGVDVTYETLRSWYPDEAAAS